MLSKTAARRFVPALFSRAQNGHHEGHQTHDPRARDFILGFITADADRNFSESAAAASLAVFSMCNSMSIGLFSCLTVHFVVAPSAGSFLGQLDNCDDQQDYHQHADHRPKPHPAARPSTHPSVSSVHHKKSLEAFLYLLFLLKLVFCDHVVPGLAWTWILGDTEKAESKAHACAVGLNRPQEKEERGNGAPHRGTPQA